MLATSFVLFLLQVLDFFNIFFHSGTKNISITKVDYIFLTKSCKKGSLSTPKDPFQMEWIQKLH